MQEIYPVPEEFKKPRVRWNTNTFSAINNRLMILIIFGQSRLGISTGSSHLHKSKIPVMTLNILKSSGLPMVSLMSVPIV
jgi:hypothetical protein